MQLIQNIEAVRATGTLDIELADGRTATLEVDIDLSQHGTEFGLHHEYEQITTEYGSYLSTAPRPDRSGYSERPDRWTMPLGRCVATTHSLRIPTSNARSREDGGASWTLRIPVEENGQ